MKSLPVLMLSTLVAIASAADSARGKRTAIHKLSRASGGIIEKAYDGNLFRVFNLQNNITFGAISRLTLNIRRAALLPIECVDRGFTNNVNYLSLAKDMRSENGVGAALLVIKDSSLPIELVSPDGSWGILNIAPLLADSPSCEKLEKRFEKVYWGMVARTLGAGISSYPGCVLVPFSNIKELDEISSTRLCPEPFNKMIANGKVLGIGTLTIATYRSACQLGWAPAPTNDVQKSIWAEVHELPAEPIVIKPETKPVSE